jgi:hypothetical protein
MPDQNAHKPAASISHGTDPFQGFEGKPMIGSVTEQSHYLGRVVIELWEPGTPTGRGDQMAYIISPAQGVKNSDLLQRAMKAISVHLEQQQQP